MKHQGKYLTKGISFGLLIRITFNIIRSIALFFISRARIRLSFLQLLSINTSVRVKGRDGKITIRSKLNTGKNVSLLADGGELEIGKSVYFNNNCTVVAQNLIRIGDGSTFGPNVCIFDHDHNYKRLKPTDSSFLSTPITVGKNVWVGANAVILRGSIIGDNSVIAAGTVVNGQFPEDCVIYDRREKVVVKRK